MTLPQNRKPRSHLTASKRAAPPVDTESDTGPAGRARMKTGVKRGGRGEQANVLFDMGKSLTPLEVHELVTQGLAAEKARELMESFRYIDRETVLKTIGISERTLQRARAADKPLDSNASDRSLRLAAVTEQAIEILGSQDAAERWLATPAMGLDRRRPIDLLQSSEGAELVKTLLTRIEHGVYA